MQLHFRCGLVAQRLGHIEDSIRFYNRAIALDDPLQQNGYCVLARQNRAAAYQQLGQHELAITEYRRHLAVQPDNALVLNNLGYVARKGASAPCVSKGFPQAFAHFEITT